MKKRIAALILTVSLLLTGCGVNNGETDRQQDSLSENTLKNPQDIELKGSAEGYAHIVKTDDFFILMIFAAMPAKINTAK